jgi:predicted nuclease of predicted toxin-antitoxin system
VARLLADENMPLAVVEELRSQGHDVVTLVRSLLGTGVSDTEILARARFEKRAVLTLDRRDFFRLHREQPDHEGIIACTFDPDSAGQARRVHAALPAEGVLRGILLRVNRPPR